MTTTALALLLTAGGAWAAPPPVPATPAAAGQLLYARPFVLDKGYTFRWSAERSTVTEGLILVLEVDPDLVYPRQSAEPVLYVGHHVAQRLNNAYPSGVLLALVPARVDLTATPIWFGKPELPERVTIGMRAAQRAEAEAASIHPFPPATVETALEKGGAPMAVEDVAALDHELRKLFLEYAR